MRMDIETLIFKSYNIIGYMRLSMMCTLIICIFTAIISNPDGFFNVANGVITSTIRIF